MKSLVEGLLAFAREIVFLVGLIMVGAGLAQVSTAAALAVPGAVLVWLSVPPRKGER